MTETMVSIGSTAEPDLVLDRQRPVAQQIFTHLRLLIQRLHLKPGESLSEKDLSARLGVSRTPVREALIRLSEEGLVDIFPQRGTLVAPIRMAEVEEAQFLREVLETAVVRRAAERVDAKTLSGLSDNLAKQATVLQIKDFDTLMELDEQFHNLLCDGAALPRAWRIVQSAKGRLDRVRYISFPAPGHGDLVYRQHMAILDAVKAGDPERAGREMHDHLQEIWNSIERLMRENEGLFQP